MRVGSRIILLGMVVGFSLARLVARGDTVVIEGNAYEGEINGIREGKLSITIKGVERSYALAGVQTISLDGVSKVGEAEAVRGSDAKAAAALYKQAIPAINNGELKKLVEFRAIGPTDKDGRWSEAVGLFLDVYAEQPVEGIWQGRPTHFPGAGSKLLVDSAEAVAAAVKTERNEEAKKNLRTFLLDIYTKEGDTEAAGRLAKEMASGVAEEGGVGGSGGGGGDGRVLPTEAMAAIADIDGLLQAKRFDVALLRAQGALERFSGAGREQAAVRLFGQMAQAYEGLNRPEDAAAAWLRIPAYFPSDAAGAGALLRAAEIEKKLDHAEEAGVLYREIAEKFPASAEAATARAGMGGK